MSRKLASVVRISACEPIPDTDRLSVAMMEGKGWKVVTARDEFKVGDLAVYFEIDSYLPSNDERYAFLRDRCLRKFVSKSGNVLREGLKIKTIKLRGVISQGLLMPIRKFPEIESRRLEDFNGKWWLMLDPEQEGMDNPLVELVGADVTAILHVEHYDEIKEQLQPACGGKPLSVDVMGRFPSEFIPKTDEERCIDGNTKISTTSGVKKVKELYKSGCKNIAVLSRNIEKSVDEFNDIISISKSKLTDNWLKITTEDGKSLVLTDNHKVFLPLIGAYRQASDLVVGDAVLIKTD